MAHIRWKSSRGPTWEDRGEIIIVTAYGHEPHVDALLMALTAIFLPIVIDLYTIDVSDILEDPTDESSGELETSLMLFLAPETVRMEALSSPDVEAASRTYMRGRAPTPPALAEAMVRTASLASAEKGRRVFERYVGTVAEALS